MPVTQQVVRGMKIGIGFVGGGTLPYMKFDFRIGANERLRAK